MTVIEHHFFKLSLDIKYKLRSDISLLMADFSFIGVAYRDSWICTEWCSHHAARQQGITSADSHKTKTHILNMHTHTHTDACCFLGWYEQWENHQMGGWRETGQGALQYKSLHFFYSLKILRTLMLLLIFVVTYWLSIRKDNTVRVGYFDNLWALQ